MRHWTGASLLAVLGVYAAVTHHRVAVALVGAGIVAAIVTRARLSVGPIAARFFTALAVGFGAVVGWTAPALSGVDVLQRPWPSIALAALFAGVARLFIVAPGADAPVSAVVPGLVALMATGETNAGPAYLVAVVVWLVFALLALRAGDAGRPALRAMPARDRAGAVLVVALALALAAGAALALPPLSLWTEGRILHALGDVQTGFSDRLSLGSLDGMLDSDEIVMRVDGPPTDYLRGAAYDRYELGRWSRARTPSPRALTLPELPPARGDRVHVSIVSGARDRYFLPLGASGVAATSGRVAVDGYGVVRVADGVAAEASFAPGGRPDFAIDEPSADDLAVPPLLRPTLERLAREWTAGVETPRARIDAIATRLRTRFTYARSFQRKRVDPLLDFLLDDPRGHCEYFASATVLLARAAGVPSRVVVGYRVAEQSPLGGYYLVREKNAHAWAEVYLAGEGFVTVDATPSAGDEQNAPHRAALLGAVVDLARAWGSRMALRVTLADVVRGGLVVAIAGLVARWWRRRERAKAIRGDARARAERQPAGLAALFDALARRGLVRGAAEPLERFAARVEARGEAEAAALLERWAAFRYGGIGDGEVIASELGRQAESVRRGRGGATSRA